MWHNGTDLSGYLDVLEVTGRSLSPNEIQSIVAAGRDGAFFQGKRKPGVPLKVRAMLRHKSSIQLRAAIDELNGILDTDEPVPIIFGDEPQKTYYGILSSIEEGTEIKGVHVVTITFWRGDPYKYGPEQPHQFTDATLLTNEGTAEAQPIFELEVLAPVTFAMVSNGEEYNLLGVPTYVGEEVVEAKTLIFREDGSTIDGWINDTNPIDGGLSQGAMTTDGSGIVVDSYGPIPNPFDWHGPTILKEVPVTQDFEIETIMELDTSVPAQTARIDLHFIDEFSNNMGKLAILDRSRGRAEKEGEARYGPTSGAYETYPIDRFNYKFDYMERLYAYLRVRRVGNEFDFYIARLDPQGKHRDPISKRYVDVNNEYNGKLRYIKVNIARYSEFPPDLAKIYWINVYSLADRLENQVPYMANLGDIITFDHVNDELLINGEDRKDIKDFGGSFFSLAKGENQLAVLPSGAFNAKVKYRPRYR
ncbi:phage tail family protein [Virgibacillus halodenitrificans]|uniref:Phage tail family protein n=2 Tax=Virgibacillus halodenitrificans TaxID=1482 RepID=A0ABR7VRW3_VIRHA|nr:phage tail family protein [Virgibacillus halodenitrificans]